VTQYARVVLHVHVPAAMPRWCQGGAESAPTVVRTASAPLAYPSHHWIPGQAGAKQWQAKVEAKLEAQGLGKWKPKSKPPPPRTADPTAQQLYGPTRRLRHALPPQGLLNNADMHGDPTAPGQIDGACAWNRRHQNSRTQQFDTEQWQKRLGAGLSKTVGQKGSTFGRCPLQGENRRGDLVKTGHSELGPGLDKLDRPHDTRSTSLSLVELGCTTAACGRCAEVRPCLQTTTHRRYTTSHWPM
jgi:hypothetical protein